MTNANPRETGGKSPPPDIGPEFFREMGRTLQGFALVHLSHYFVSPKDGSVIPPAPFHADMIGVFSDRDLLRLIVRGFRGSAKSTFGTLALPLWGALEGVYPFIILGSDTEEQGIMYLANIKNEIESNPTILAVYGDVRSKDDWGATSITLKNGVKIMVRSRGQKVRGLRHRQHRPKLAIVDDPEDREWVKSKQNRDKTTRWIVDELIPGLDKRVGRFIGIGNILNSDDTLTRLTKRPGFVTRDYPICDETETVSNWPGMYPDAAALAKAKEEAGFATWMREMRLKVVPDEGQDVKEEWIVKYKAVPEGAALISKGCGVDLAISLKATADFTTFVRGHAYMLNGKPKIYIQADPVNAHLTLDEIVSRARLIAQADDGTKFFVEGVAFQKAAIELLKKAWLNVDGVVPIGDKRARLQTIVGFIKDGTIEFAEQGCEDLIIQLTHFGVEAHDDLVDAFVYLVLGLMKRNMAEQKVAWI